jgi:hypothetical protein
VKVTRRVLAELPDVYAVGRIELSGRVHVVAATEGRGATLLFRPPGWRPSVLSSGPGGVMCLESCPLPGPGIVMIDRFYPIMAAEGARISLAAGGADPEAAWAVRPLAEIPFAHRLKVVRISGRWTVVAATVSGPGKSSPEDWSRPGAVYAGALPRDPTEALALHPVLEGLSQNHGLAEAVHDGHPCLLVACRNGVYGLSLPERSDAGWEVQKLLDHPASEAQLFDLDGDGTQELVTIEPFHGNRLFVYRRSPAGWDRTYEAELSFGHVLWCGTILGRPAILSASRSGGAELTLHLPENGRLSEFTSIQVDRGVGPTQVEVVHAAGSDLIFSANHGASQVVLYTLTP